MEVAYGFYVQLNGADRTGSGFDRAAGLVVQIPATVLG
jgi:hypothetical protein